MKRATLIYLVSLSVCIVGMWLVFIIGSKLQAPPVLSGRWLLVLEDAPPAATIRIDIEQSGRFLRLVFDDGHEEDFLLHVEDHPPGQQQLRLRGNVDEFVFTPLDSADSEFTHIVQRINPLLPDAQSLAYRARRVASRAADSIPVHAESLTAERSPASSISLLISQLAIIIIASRLVGYLATLIHQPRVVGEMIAGLMLGPSLLGWALPEVSATVFPVDSIHILGLLAQLGVIFFLFIIGLELDPRLLRNRGHAALVISHISIVAPLLLGAALTLYLYGLVFNDTPQMRFDSVALFIGAAMSITAFPVLARILTERNLHKTPVGATAITCAAIDDVSAWCLLAFVIGLVRTQGVGDAVMTTALSVVYVLLMLFAVRPFLKRVEAYYDRQGKITTGVLALLMIFVLCSALATEAIGIHALFGAFMAGAVMPNGTRFVREVSEHIENFTLIMLLPIFFAFTGLNTRIELLNSPDLWMLTLIVVAVACLGKFGGSMLAAKSCGLPWRESSAIGILMNTRGLMELVILNIGRELGVITDAVFAMMVVMALVTTFLTTPILRLVYPDRLIRSKLDLPEIAPRRNTVLIPISLPRSARSLVHLADLITGPGNVARRIIGLHLRRAEERDAYSAAAGQSVDAASEPLLALQSNAELLGINVEPVSFVSRDAAADIARTAAEFSAGLVIMGFHKPIIGSTILGGTVHRVLQNAPCDVAIFVDRGLPDRPASILVPYLGSDHDRLALQLASTIAQHSDAAVTVLHIISPKAGDTSSQSETDRQRLHAKTVTDKVFNDPTQSKPVTFKVIPSNDPIGVVLEHCKPFDLVLVGIAGMWGLESQLFGWRAERIARDCPTSMLIVRKTNQPPPQSARESIAR